MNRYLTKIAASGKIGLGVFKPYTNTGNTGGGSRFINKALYHNSTPPVSNPRVKKELNVVLDAGLAVKKSKNFNNSSKISKTKISNVTIPKRLP